MLLSLFGKALNRGQNMTRRLDYATSCQKLHKLGLTASANPPLPDRLPRYDDEEPLGVNFFKTEVSGDLSGLTLPRTFFGRSEITKASFRNSDLHESNLCWNDFSDVNFGKADLSRCDIRASLLESVFFHDCNLALADLRQSGFTGCSFEGASMKGAVLTYEQKEALHLSASQISEISWTHDPGEEPDGG